MNRYHGIPELLEQFMQEQSREERWITVQEIRDRFGLTRYQCNTVSGFLRRLHVGTFGQCPYIVVRIEIAERAHLSDPPKCQYLVKRKTIIDADIPGMCIILACKHGVKQPARNPSRGSRP